MRTGEGVSALQKQLHSSCGSILHILIFYFSLTGLICYRDSLVVIFDTFLFRLSDRSAFFTFPVFRVRHPTLNERLQLSPEVCDMESIFVDDGGFVVLPGLAIPAKAVWKNRVIYKVARRYG